MSFNCCFPNRGRLPIINNYDILKSIRINMSNGESYTVTVGDIVKVQFIKDDKQILIREGRIKDINIVNRRCLSTANDNVSYITLDASQQFSIKLIDIKLKDIIKIGDITDRFIDYSDVTTELEPNYIEGREDGMKIPTRHDGMVTKEEYINKITKPGKENVVKMDSSSGQFDDLYEMNQNRPDLNDLKVSKAAPRTDGRLTSKGFMITR